MPKQKSNRILKFIIVFLGLFLISGNIFGSLRFIGADKVYANLQTTPGTPEQKPAGQTTTVADQNKDRKGFVETLEQMNKAIYVMIWPMLVIAGVSMDNDLVYGKVFNFDVALWQFWNLTKNFSNYIIGFLFIASVIFYFMGYKQDKFAPNKLLPKLLVGGVLVQASWFLLGAMIDISTVATYGIGAMPLNVIKGTELGKTKIYLPASTSSNIDPKGATGKGDNSAKLYYKSGDKAYSMCSVVKVNEKESEYKNIPVEGVSTSSVCLTSIPGLGLRPINPGTYDGEGLKNAISDDGGLNMSDLIKKGKGLTGPLYALYGSFVNFARIDVTASNKSTSSLGGEFVLKIIVSVALMIPMIALAIALIMRTVALWLIIGFAPIIVLFGVLGFKLPEGIDEKFNLKSVLGLLFMPVAAVFGVGISLIFIASINNSRGTQKGAADPKAGILGITVKDEGNQTCWEFDGRGMKQCWKKGDADFGGSVMLDLLNWILISVLSIALMRSVVFMCLKTSKIVSGVVGSIENFAKSMAMATPIIPGGLSLGAMNNALGTLQSMPNTITRNQYSQSSLGKYLNSVGSGGSGGAGGGSGGIADFASVGSGDESGFAKAFAGSSAEDLKKNQAAVLAAFNKATNQKIGDVNGMLENREFRKIMAGQQFESMMTKLSSLTADTSAVEKVRESVMNAITSLPKKAAGGNGSAHRDGKGGNIFVVSGGKVVDQTPYPSSDDLRKSIAKSIKLKISNSGENPTLSELGLPDVPLN